MRKTEDLGLNNNTLLLKKIFKIMVKFMGNYGHGKMNGIFYVTIKYLFNQIFVVIVTTININLIFDIALEIDSLF